MIKGKKIAIVTGATGGLGREFVRLLLKEKNVDEIWALARNEKKLSRLKDKFGKKIKIYSMDVGVVHSGTSINQGTLTQSLSIGKKKTIGGSVGLNNKGSLIVATDYTVTSDKSETTTEISVEISWMVLAAALGCLLIPELMVAMPAFVKFMA